MSSGSMCLVGWRAARPSKVALLAGDEGVASSWVAMSAQAPMAASSVKVLDSSRRCLSELVSLTVLEEPSESGLASPKARQSP